jgi:hypothetical protein
VNIGQFIISSLELVYLVVKDFSMLNMLNSFLQSFAEKLFARLQGCTERFEVLFLLYWSADVHLLHDNDMIFCVFGCC